ncbi:Clavaminate synthase [Fusarium globosum]|uniref:Clavaminate synthase n=1 Tax=Fusarium globosum TaxID=78864 RepID=A0A8H6D5D0_9HYPO|nr:Clavaminate synthase [Fusarium globosum]
MPPVLFRYSRYPILGWPCKRNSELPAPRQKQMRALDAVQFIAQKNTMSLPISRGDMVFINDLAVFHARGEFKDGDAGWQVPQSLQETFGARYTRKPGNLNPEFWDVNHEPDLEELSFVNG